MNINRHNYETFFLLYVDNELSAAERKAVEQFVQENTDLETELQLLQETTLPGEAIGFNAKSLLYKNEVDEEALQENLLLHLDNELDPVSSQKITAAIVTDLSVKQEWGILQQTKLDANEKIVFENKTLLYRHERDRVITMRFWKIAVAAAILFAGLFFVIRFLAANNKTAGDEVVQVPAGKPAEKKAGNNIGSNNQSAIDPAPINVPENIASANDKEENKKEDQKNINPQQATQPVFIKDEHETAINNQQQKKQKNSLPKTSLENINKENKEKTYKESNESIAANVLHKNNETVIKNEAPNELLVKTVSVKEKMTAPKTPITDYSVTAISDSYAKTTVLNETDQSNDNKILYMNEQGVARTKIGGLFRRVKRVIERNTNITSGNGVKIAGFEFAVK